MIIIAPRLTKLLSVVIDVYAIALWPFIFAREPLSPVGENHEKIHLRQQVETLIIGFYLIYAWDYLMNRAKGMSPEEAYLNICFELEAYECQGDLGYLDTRPRFAWLDY